MDPMVRYLRARLMADCGGHQLWQTLDPASQQVILDAVLGGLQEPYLQRGAALIGAIYAQADAESFPPEMFSLRIQLRAPLQDRTGEGKTSRVKWQRLRAAQAVQTWWNRPAQSKLTRKKQKSRGSGRKAPRLTTSQIRELRSIPTQAERRKPANSKAEAGVQTQSRRRQTARHGGRPKSNHQLWHERRGDEPNCHSSGDDAQGQSRRTSRGRKGCMVQTGARRSTQGDAAPGEGREEPDDFWRQPLRKQRQG